MELIHPYPGKTLSPKHAETSCSRSYQSTLRSMGIRGRNSSERLRTIWTPEMDRYFIDLMLEQVSKGNRFDDHLFSKRAWKHMTSLFSAKFKFQYEKDVLKNRYKTLRNLYKAIKNLLAQTGFSWDEKRQMVTAENIIWDQYIKAHPDARSFRIKTIPYYSDMCLIYRDATIEQKGDNVPELSPHSGENEITVAIQPRTVNEGAVEALHEITFGEDNGFHMSKGVVDDAQQTMPNVTGTTVVSRSRTYWQPPMDRYFIDLMLDQVHKGNQIDAVFRKQAWMEMIASFNAKFGFNYDLDVLKNRYKTLRRQYNVIKSLLDLNGFAWDDARQMVTADDYVWQDYIKTHSDARQFMTRPVPYYKDLCMICSDQSIDESDCFSVHCLELQNEVEEASSRDEVGDVPASAHMGLKIVVSNQKNKRQLEYRSNSVNPKKLRGKDEDDENSNSIPIECVIEAIQALPAMDEDLVLDACDFLEDEIKAKTFMALDVKLRKKWLLRKLRPES